MLNAHVLEAGIEPSPRMQREPLASWLSCVSMSIWRRVSHGVEETRREGFTHDKDAAIW